MSLHQQGKEQNFHFQHTLSKIRAFSFPFSRTNSTNQYVEWQHKVNVRMNAELSKNFQMKLSQCDKLLEYSYKKTCFFFLWTFFNSLFCHSQTANVSQIENKLPKMEMKKHIEEGGRRVKVWVLERQISGFLFGLLT